MNSPADQARAHERPEPTDVRTARLLVAGQFILIRILLVLPGRQDWPVPAALTALCSVATLIGLAVMVIAATGLGRGLTATPLPNAHAQLRTGGFTGSRGTLSIAACCSPWRRSRWPQAAGSGW